MPMLYNTRYSSKRRVTVMIAVVWVLSFAISCPLLFGLNNTGEGSDTYSCLLLSSQIARNKGGIRSEVYWDCSLPLPPAAGSPCPPGSLGRQE